MSKQFFIYKVCFRFLLQAEPEQFAVKNSCPEIIWNLYGFPMPDVAFR